MVFVAKPFFFHRARIVGVCTNSDLNLSRCLLSVKLVRPSMSARAAAAELNFRKVKTPSGAPWSAKTVIRARERLSAAVHPNDGRSGHCPARL
jgi:hypothetical protein